MRIGELADRSGLNSSANRYYERVVCSQRLTVLAASDVTQATLSIAFFSFASRAKWGSRWVKLRYS
jgi:hypothetical protein